MTLREKAIKQLRKSIPIEPNEYTESRIQKLIKIYQKRQKQIIKGKNELNNTGMPFFGTNADKVVCKCGHNIMQHETYGHIYAGSWQCAEGNWCELEGLDLWITRVLGCGRHKFVPKKNKKRVK